MTRPALDWFESRTIQFKLGFHHDLPAGPSGFHSHRGHEIVYHATGRGRVTSPEGRSIAFEPGSVVIHPRGSKHNQTNLTPGRDVCLLFSCREPSRSLPRELTDWIVIERVHDLALRREMESLAQPWVIRSALRRAQLNHRITAVLIQLLEIASAPGAAPVAAAKPRSYAEEAFALMCEHPTTMRNLSKITAQLEISDRYLRQVFQQRFNLSPKAMMLRLRIERAENLLAHSTLPIKTIALQSGFANSKHLHAHFTRAVGCSPGEFRARPV